MTINIPQLDANRLLEMSESLIQMNQKIDEFKANPGNSSTIDFQFEQIKMTWKQYQSSATLGQEGHYQVIDTFIARTEKRVRKLLSKFPPLVLNPAQQMAQCANGLGFISFYDTHTDALTACFGNFFDCKIEFGGKHYLNSESIFQAQKFTDQPGMMAQFENTNGDVAVSIARKSQMTAQRSQEWHDLQTPHINKLDVMMNALRAKFGQNPHLKNMLMATGGAYLVEHLPDPHRKDRYWSDGFDGTGENQLGNCLMKLRAEYGGTGVVAKPFQYLHMIQNQNNSSNVPQNTVQSTPLQNCIQCHTRPKYYDAAIGKLHDYCGKACASAGLANKCIQCHQFPKYVDTVGKVFDYCSATCARQAGVLN
jgi:N-glycosidase YbiA